MSNRVVHFEIPIDDSGKATAFYENAFGWTITKWGPVDYWLLATGGEPEPGVDGALTPRSEAPDGVLIYVDVDDIDAAIRRVESAGGHLVTAKVPVPGMGWRARFRDPDGNVLGLFQAGSAPTDGGQKG